MPYALGRRQWHRDVTAGLVRHDWILLVGPKLLRERPKVARWAPAIAGADLVAEHVRVFGGIVKLRAVQVEGRIDFDEGPAARD